MTCKALDGWKAFTTSGDSDQLRSFLSEDIVFESPVLHTPQVGKDAAMRYFNAAHATFSGRSFRFVREWVSDTGAVLEFRAQIGPIEINGVDIVTFDSDREKITGFKVMLRPFKAIQAVGQSMASELAPAQQ